MEPQKSTAGKLPVAISPPGSKFVALGGHASLFSHPNRPDQLIKVPAPFTHAIQALETENRIYVRLGSHQNLVKWINMDEYGIWLERASHGNLREFYATGHHATLQHKTTWCRDLANIIHFVHTKNVRHADLSGRNLLVDSALAIKLCDFGGSSIDDQRATVFAESGYRHPDEKEYLSPTVQAEIHSLGSTIYEIMTEKQPHHGLPDYEVDALMVKGEYPSLEAVPLNEIILMCWKGRFTSAADVANEIEKNAPEYFLSTQAAGTISSQINGWWQWIWKQASSHSSPTTDTETRHASCMAHS